MLTAWQSGMREREQGGREGERRGGGAGVSISFKVTPPVT
jgi:hypothetical protein